MIFYVAVVFLCCECYYSMLHWTGGDGKAFIGRPDASKPVLQIVRQIIYCTNYIFICVFVEKKQSDTTKHERAINLFFTGPVFGCKIPNSKKNFLHLHGVLNLDEIKNALRLLSVNGETNLMNLIRL